MQLRWAQSGTRPAAAALALKLLRSMSRRPHCPRCQLPSSSCLCAWIRPTSNVLPVLILQHAAEAKQAKGSARLLALSLLNCRVQVGEHFEPATLSGWLTCVGVGSPAPSPLHSVLLYPGAATPGAASSSARPAPQLPHAQPALQQLVLLDGTWRQARQLLRCNPLLQTLPRRPLTAPAPGRYGLRKAQRPEQRSTLEAACCALAEDDPELGRYAPLLQAFDGWVAECLGRAQWNRPRPPE